MVRTGGPVRKRAAAPWRAAWAVPVLLAVALVVTGCGLLPSRGNGAGGRLTALLPYGSTQHRLMVDGHQRSFRLYRPPSLSVERDAPLVVMLHGAMGSGRQAESAYGWNERADRAGFLVAYPDGLNRSWAISGSCCGPPAVDGVNDVGFVLEVVKAISSWTPVDRTRVYVSGMSNGGMLAYKLACETSVFAAVGAVATTMLGPCPSPEPLAVIHIHGTADPVVPYTGGPGQFDNGGGGDYPVEINGPPTPKLMATWRGIDQCSRPSVRSEPPLSFSTATCPNGLRVDLIAITGAGHEWPGADASASRLRRGRAATEPAPLKATDTIWEFFAQHSKPN